MPTTINGTDNSAATPALVGNDTDTGVFFPAANTMAFSTGGTEQVRVTSAGDVGIGTSSPLQRLDVASTATSVFQTIRSTSSGATNIALRIQDGTTGTSNTDGIYLGRTGSENYLWTYENEPWIFATNNTERMRINSSGQVLMGTTGVAGGERLSVVSTGTITGWFQSTNAATSGLINMYSVVPTTAFNTNCAHFAGQTAGVNTWFLYANGTTSYTSDANLKKNIVTTRDGYLDDLDKLRVVKYQWKVNPDDSPTELGLIAQEVAEVFPNLVKDSIPTKEGDPTNKVILGSVFQPILIKCVQELNTQLKELKTELDSVKAELATLKASQ
jgi:hypothetical protein